MNVRYLICDGGRTNHALVSDWETHRLEVFPDRQGEPVLSQCAVQHVWRSIACVASCYPVT